MKNLHSAFAAAALASVCLLTALATSRADDLLDAVLWDGPSAFPSKSTPADEPPPAAEPAPQAVPPASAPSPRPSASDPVFADSSDSPTAAPLPTASDPVPGETQIRREIREMRARADRLEAALGPAAPPKPARPPYDRADWPKRARLSLNGSYNSGSDADWGGVAEFAIPLADTPFDVALRGYSMEYRPDEKHGYVSSNRRTDFYEEKTVTGATVWGIWYPWRGAVASPHAGVGVGYESTTGFKDYWEYGTGRYRDGENRHEDLDDDGLTLAGRVGATLTYKRFTLKGEFLLTSETKVFLAEAGLRIWEHLVLNGLVERYDVDLSDACTAFGGGITILF